jgi:cyclase
MITTTRISRRSFLKAAAIVGGMGIGPGRLLARSLAAQDSLAARGAELAVTPIEAVKLTNLITLLTGPGGNVLVRSGEEGKVVVDTFVDGAFPALKQRLDAMGNTPILYVINTHWHFDHTANNERFRQAGAQIIAHENAKQRLSTAALPMQTFTRFHNIQFNLPGTEEFIDLEYIPRAHSDTDISVRFVMGDVLHLGDTFFNGTYPFIDAETGGSINGTIAAAESALKMVNPGTKVVPGHGPLADRMALMRYRDMLVTIRDRVQKLKTTGRSEQEVVTAKPTADLDATWGQGFIQAADFVSVIYKTL